MPCTEVIIALVNVTVTVVQSSQHSLGYALPSDGLKYFICVPFISHSCIKKLSKGVGVQKKHIV